MREPEVAERHLECRQSAADHLLARAADRRPARTLALHRRADTLQRSEHVRHESTSLIIWGFLAQRVQGPREVIRAALDVIPLSVGGSVTGEAVRGGDLHRVK